MTSVLTCRVRCFFEHTQTSLLSYMLLSQPNLPSTPLLSVLLVGETWICADKHMHHTHGGRKSKTRKRSDVMNHSVLTDPHKQMHWSTTSSPKGRNKTEVDLPEPTYLQTDVHRVLVGMCACTYCMSTTSVPVAWFVPSAPLFYPVNTFYWVN